MEDATPGPWVKGISAITLFVADRDAAKAFYANAFGLPVHYEDPQSCVFRFGSTLINLLVQSAAPELVEPATVAPRDAGVRLQLTIDVDDVDAMHAELTRRGVAFLNGPIDRPWGIRTAAFADLDHHVWEIAR